MDEPQTLIPPPEAAPEAHADDPAWGWSGVALIFGVYFVSLFICAMTAALVEVSLYGQTRGQTLSTMSMLTASTIASLVTLLAIWRLTSSARGWLKELFWNWPEWRMPAFLGAGMALAVALQLLASAFPAPGKLPIDDFYTDAATSWAMVIFGVLVAPVTEEALFRGVLYPVLRKQLGAWLAILISAVAFTSLHAAQLGGAWQPLAAIAIVGLTLGWAREKTNSLACCLLLHMGYNGLIFGAVLWSTNGFRHMESLPH